MFQQVQQARLAIENTRVPCVLPAYTLANLITTEWTARLHTERNPVFQSKLYETPTPRRCMLALVLGILTGETRVRMIENQLAGIRFPADAGQQLVDVLIEYQVPHDTVIRARYAIHGA